MMNRKLILPVAIAAGTLSFASILPNAHAGSMEKQTMESRTDAAQAAIKDAWLHGKLETALLFNEHLNSFDINSEVKNGTAHLYGAVESDIDRDLAEEIAKSIKGVNAVENQLEIDKSKAAAARSGEAAKERQGFKQDVLNATLTARVKSRLLVNSNTGGMAIDVDSRNGVVTLSGRVDSEQEKELAAQIAANTNGTVSVDDRLTVESAEEAE